MPNKTKPQPKCSRNISQRQEVPDTPLDSRATVQPLDAEQPPADPPTLALEVSLLDPFTEALQRGGIVGEARAAMLIYLCLVSRLLDRPVSLAVKGPTSAGKSYLVEQVLRFFPTSAYYALTAMSERVLAYSTEPLAHRFLVLYEEAGIRGEVANYLLRSLLSEGRIAYETVERAGDTFRARRIEREGPTGLLVTTTRPHLHPENETRLLSVTVQDSPEQTGAILESLARTDKAHVDVTDWWTLQEWLTSHGERRVDVPFALQLARSVPSGAVRLRRDFGALLQLVRTHALLHQANRKRNGEGHVVATINDYGVVRELVHDLIAEGVETSVPAIVRETVGVVARLEREGLITCITIATVATQLGLDKSSTSRRVKTAIARGYLFNEETRRGQPANLQIGDPLPEDQQLLPTVETLRNAINGGCTVAVEPQGIERVQSTNQAEGPVSDAALFAAWCRSRRR